MAGAGSSGGATEAMRCLTDLSLVSKVCSELEAHGGVGDRDHADFIVHLARRSPSVAEFHAKLREHEFQAPDYLARTLHTVIHAIPAAAPQNPTGPAATRRMSCSSCSTCTPSFPSVDPSWIHRSIGELMEWISGTVDLRESVLKFETV
ncbi:hypothetical protein QYE76_011701 [Lolium multiflorum]|uniref:Uncharacterized protein n=1 Tax=Lolium multiflorum TaxID=4521 RepID=A0AAD8TZN9_LOLMU|nr:hypothetical protein QYE76_011701 [Lolium multiflorum]